MKTDSQLHKDVLDALAFEPSLDAANIGIAVKGGVVTLTGSVDRQYQKKHAESAARFLIGVRGVTNIIQVKPHITPKDVQTRIEQAFDRQAYIDASRIRVEVSGGKVTLRGNVTSYAERDEAEQVAWSAAGVTEVKNEIMVEPWFDYSAVEPLMC